MRFPFAALALVLALVPARAQDQAASPPRSAAIDHAALVADVAQKFLAPRYRDLAEAAAANQAAWRAFCPDNEPARLAPVQDAHRRLALSFAAVQSFRFGPMGEGSTVERLYFWPERKNATARGLAGLLAGGTPFTAEKIARASAAAQGIPALERFAFPGPDDATLAAGGDEAAKRNCAAALAIAGNVAALARSVAEAWNAPGTGLAARLARGDLDPGLAPSMTQAATTLVTDFMTTLAVIQDQKLEPVLGGDADAAKPLLAEATRAGLTTAMIAANAEGLRGFVAALDRETEALQRKSWDALLARVAEQARTTRGFPGGVAVPATRAPAEALLARLKSVRAILADEVPVALGLKLGFNGLDGD